jgi:hypothetical protein
MEILKSLFEKQATKPAQDTGLPFSVYVSNNPKTKHNRPRLKLFGPDGEEWSVSFDDNIQILAGDASKIKSKEWKRIVKWISANRNGLILAWNNSMSPDEFFNKHTPLTEETL